jgi:hypothetical protein
MTKGIGESGLELGKRRNVDVIYEMITAGR